MFSYFIIIIISVILKVANQIQGRDKVGRLVDTKKKYSWVVDNVNV
jgi:hypothetical protein